MLNIFAIHLPLIVKGAFIMSFLWDSHPVLGSLQGWPCDAERREVNRAQAHLCYNSFSFLSFTLQPALSTSKGRHLSVSGVFLIISDCYLLHRASGFIAFDYADMDSRTFMAS